MTSKMTDPVPATVLELRKSAATPARRWLLVWVVALNAVGIRRVHHLRGTVGR
jgi:hypothetical protein